MSKPKIGLLGITQSLYVPMFDNFLDNLSSNARAYIERLGENVEIHFSAPSPEREEIEANIKEFNEKGLDGIMLVMLTYGAGMRLIRALKDNNLPILLANIQPEKAVGDNWNMTDLTYNQGIHGAQDTANALLQSGKPFSVITEDWRSDRFVQYVVDWAYAAKASVALKSAKIAQMGEMLGMGDIRVDHGMLMRKIGPQIDYFSPGVLYKLMEETTDSEVDDIVAENKKNFEIDEKLPEKNHRYACRMQAAFKRYLTEGGYSGFSVYFDALGLDGRFSQLHMLAASNLMAEGFAYGAEGDVLSCVAVCAGNNLATDANFTEMYAHDFERDSVLMSHMGEGNWRLSAKDDKPILMDRPLGIGGMDNPPTVVFRAAPGEATLVSLVSISGKFKIIAAYGDILETPIMKNVEMPYFHFRPKSGIRKCLDEYLKNGGSHHQCINRGDIRQRWQMLANILDIEYVEV